MSTLQELTRTVELAGDLHQRSVLNVVGAARATIARWREGSGPSETMLYLLADAVDMQREMEHRLGLAHAARLDAVMALADGP